MHSAWFRSTFLRVWKFLQIKEGGPNFWEEPILQKVWIIWSPVLYFNFKSFTDPNSSSFTRYQCILHDSGVLFLASWNFCKLKRRDLISRGNQFSRKCELLGHFFCIWILEGGPNSWGEPILQKVWIIWSPLLYSNFKSFTNPNSSSFIRFQCILHDSGVLFSDSWYIYQLKKGDLISRGNQFCRRSELFGPPFCISILKVLGTQILYHSLDFNAFCMIQEHFSRSLEISTN